MHNDYADRKNGRKPVEYFHPDAEELLADTYGLMIYQESVMRVAQKFAGYSLAEADSLRKAMGKKVREIMAKERDKFVDGVQTNGYERALGDQLFDIIQQFADYAFNKSHSYGYGYIAYQIAYLKAHYAVEYLAALLTSVKNNLEKAAVYLNECRVRGIEVTVPDINQARSGFFPVPELDGSGTGKIFFGLSAVRNVGEGLVELLLAERDANGSFQDFFEFCERVDMQVLNKRTVESLIKAGAFDSLGHPRQGLLTVFEQVIDSTVARRRERDMGVMTLFGDAGADNVFDEKLPIPDLEFDKSRRLAFEKEMLGLYVSDHPLLGVEAALRRQSDAVIADLEELADGAIRTLGGVITGLQKKWTKKGELMAVFVLEDLQGSIEAMVFPKTMAVIGHLLADDVVVLCKARLDARDDTPKLIVMEIEPFQDTSGRPHHRSICGWRPRRSRPRRCSSYGCYSRSIPVTPRCSSTSPRAITPEFCGFPIRTASMPRTAWSASSGSSSAPTRCSSDSQRRAADQPSCAAATDSAGLEGVGNRDRGLHSAMAIEVESKDCASVTDAELDVMAAVGRRVTERVLHGSAVETDRAVGSVGERPRQRETARLPLHHPRTDRWHAQRCSSAWVRSCATRAAARSCGRSWPRPCTGP